MRARYRRWLGWGLALAVWGIVLVVGVVAYCAYDLPDVSKLNQVDRHPSVTLMGADGTAIATFGDLYGDFVPLREMPPALPAAVLATEDRRFYSHFGIDIFGLLRATLANLRAGQVVQGGSTITQQLAKNVFLTPARTLKRKVQEVLLALWLEHNFSKQQILTLYLNRVYFGAGTYGVDAASERYFGKSVRQLDLAECAMLAGLLKAPSRFAPTANLAGARERAAQVLANMEDAHYITAAQARAAAAHPASAVQPATSLRNARYFADWVMDEVNDDIGPGWSDIVVTTTLDPRLQADAEKSVEAVLNKSGEARDAQQAALVALDHDGAVKAMVGGRDYRDSPFNRSTQARRQPGSAFKLFVYLAGLEAGLTPDTTMVDQPVSVGKWQPKNDNGRYQGEVSLRDAFAHSINTVSVQISQRVGMQHVIDMAHRLGISEDLQPVPSLALGTSEVNLLELASAYDQVANGGYGVVPHGISEIRSRDGQILYRRLGSGPGRVLSEEVDREMNQLLAGVVESGTGRAALLDRPAAGKTGTTQDFRDAWFIGYTADLVAGVWVGNDDAEPMKRVTGGSLPVRIWRDFMLAGESGQPPQPLLAGVPGAAGGTVTPSHRSLWDKIIAEFGQSTSRPAAVGGTVTPRADSGMYHSNTDPAPQVGPAIIR
ncbi:MAG TPA: PBP1A family penicillin-binding protein [Candidatus Sulfotelmatobacter sp.]|nr:PBP1A family penicillin-binding protein [Candidatus Sulfotelmatobacter sp.]